MVALTRHSSSRADPTRRAVMRIPTLVQRVFGSVTVWRSPSLTSLVWAHADRNTHGEVRSPCVFRRARHEEKRGELGLCQTSRRARARNPGVRTRKKGYASRQLPRTVPASPAGSSASIWGWVRALRASYGPAGVSVAGVESRARVVEPSRHHTQRAGAKHCG